jgi:hypothetical protein
MTKVAANKPIPVSALAYRPRDYFGRYDLQAELLSTVKGRARRALIKEALETGEADTLPDFVTTYDVTVLYARRVGQRIHYRVVDEYEGDTLEEPSTRTSTKPLTMGKMIDFFITAWNLMDCLESNFDQDVEEMLGFFTAESEFYPCFDQILRERVLKRFINPT